MANAFTITNEATRILITGGSLTNRATPEDIVTQLTMADSAQTDFVRIATKTYVLGKPVHIAGFFDASSSAFHCDASNIFIARSGGDWLDGAMSNGVPVLGSVHIITGITGPSAVNGIFNAVDIVQDQDCMLRWHDVVYDIEDSTTSTITLQKALLAVGEVLSVTFQNLSQTNFPAVLYTVPLAAADPSVYIDIIFIHVTPTIFTVSSAFRTGGRSDCITITGIPSVNINVSTADASIHGLIVHGALNIVPIVPTGMTLGLTIRDLSGDGARTLTMTPTTGFTGIRVDKTLRIEQMIPFNPNIATDTSGVALSIIDSTDVTATPYNYGYSSTTPVPVVNNAFVHDAVLQGVLQYAADGTVTQRLQPRITLRKFGYLEDSVVIAVSTNSGVQEHRSRLAVDDAIEVDLSDTTGIFGVTVGNNAITVTPAFVGSLIEFYALVHAEYAEQANINIPIGVRRFGQRYRFAAITSFVDNASILGAGELIQLLGDLTVSTTAMISAYLQYVSMSNGMSISVSSIRTLTDPDDSIYYAVSHAQGDVTVNTSGPITSNLTVTLNIFNLTLAFGRADNANVFLAPLSSTYDLRIVKVDSAINVTTGAFPDDPLQLIPSYNVIPSLGGLTLMQLNGFVGGRMGSWTFATSTIAGADYLLTIDNAGSVSSFSIALSLQSEVYNNPGDYMAHPFNYSGGLLNMPTVRVNLTGDTSLDDPSNRINLHSLVFASPFESHVTTASGGAYLRLNVDNVNDNAFSYLLVTADGSSEPTTLTQVTGASGSTSIEISEMILLTANTEYVLMVTSSQRRPQRIRFHSAESFVLNVDLQEEPRDITYSLNTEAFYDTSGMNAGVIKTSVLSLVLADGPTETLLLELDGTNAHLITFSEARKVFYDIKQSYNYLLYRARNDSNDETILIGENSITLSGLIIIRRDEATASLNSLEFEIGLITTIDRTIVTPRARNNLRVEFVPAFGFDSGRSIAVDVASELERNGVLNVKRFLEIKDI